MYDDGPIRRWNPWLSFLRLLVAGLLGGVGTVLLVVGAIGFYVVVFDPRGGEGYGDPMAGVMNFVYFAVQLFLIGGCLGIAADLAVRLWQRRRRDRHPSSGLPGRWRIWLSYALVFGSPVLMAMLTVRVFMAHEDLLDPLAQSRAVALTRTLGALAAVGAAVGVVAAPTGGLSRRLALAVVCAVAAYFAYRGLTAAGLALIYGV